MRLLLCLILTFIGSQTSHARDVVAGPVSAQVIKVRDGDSIDVRAEVWPGHRISVSVRIRGIDAPELRARCDGEKRLANLAKDHLSGLVASGRITLTQISGGKYFGRVLANVGTSDNINVADHLLDAGLVRLYRGRKRQSWCEDVSTNQATGLVK